MTQSLSSAIGNQVDRKIKYIHGRRCQILKKLNSAEADSSSNAKIPLVLIGGTAQSIGSWEHQTHSLMRERDYVLIYECIGQGPSPPSDIIGDLNLKVNNSFAKIFQLILSIECFVKLLLLFLDLL